MSKSTEPIVHFGPFLWHQQSGELHLAQHVESTGGGAGSAGGSAEQEVLRLAPQPAKLLSHLIERRPELVTHEQIRQLLWPNVEVEFEESVHSCVRRIRAALDDSAASPQYIETIPRRGYRFLGRVKKTGKSTVFEGGAVAKETEHRDLTSSQGDREPSLLDGASAAEPSQRTRGRGPVRHLALVAGLGLLVLIGWTLLRLQGATLSANAPRVAVMPFEPLGGIGALPANNDIAEAIVEMLVNDHLSSAEVIGPTTTVGFDNNPQRITALVQELDIDYVVNARETGTETEQRLLIEIIRGCDGAHVWVNYLEDLPAGRQAAEWIAEATAQATREPAACQ